MAEHIPNTFAYIIAKITHEWYLPHSRPHGR
jgi:hypothetical protein